MNVTIRLRLSTVALLSVGASLLAHPAHADDFHHDEAKVASGGGNLVFLALGTFLPLASDGAQGTRHFLRNGDALVTTVLLTEGLKAVVRERRPDGSSRDSFPSGHASAAFAVAAMQAHWHPKEAPLWYLGAALIGESRVELKRHYWHDVLVGAALGIGMAAIEWHQPKGLLISPIYPADHSKTSGVTLNFAF